jgi:hypothetical protein
MKQAAEENGVPAMPEAFGAPASAEEARAALDRSDDDALDDGEKNSPPVGATGAEPAATTPAGQPKPKGLSKRAMARMSKRALAEHIQELSAKLEAAEERSADNAAQVAAANVMSMEDVRDSIRDICSDVIGLADSATQLSVGEKYAPVVAMDAEEKDHLTELSARYARIKAGAKIVDAPGWALVSALLCVGLGKYVAYKLAKREGSAS